MSVHVDTLFHCWASLEYLSNLFPLLLWLLPRLELPVDYCKKIKNCLWAPLQLIISLVTVSSRLLSCLFFYAKLHSFCIIQSKQFKSDHSFTLSVLLPVILQTQWETSLSVTSNKLFLANTEYIYVHTPASLSPLNQKHYLLNLAFVLFFIFLTQHGMLSFLSCTFDIFFSIFSFLYHI